MGNMEKQFSMAQELKVCHDYEKISGLQQTIKMHRFDYSHEQEIVDKYDLGDYLKQVDERV